jgi:CBS domain-containing protein
VAEDTGAIMSPVERRLPQPVRPILWCRATDLIRDVARQISAGAHSCALVRLDAGFGIVTDLDFRRRVATGEISIDAPVSELAAVPVLTVDEDATQAAALLRMVEHAVHHLVVTDREGQPIGVVRAVDLAEAEVRDPLLVRSAIDTATTIDEVVAAAWLLPSATVALCDSRVAATHVGAVHAAVVDAIVRQVLRLRADPVLAEVRHSWVMLGSLARRESLPRSDIDTALVWADTTSPDQAEAIRAAAGGVLDDLRRCGLEPCPNGTNANTAEFSGSRSEWAGAISAWQRETTHDRALLRYAMVADSRPLTEADLGRCLTDPIRGQARNTRFLRALLDEALRFRPSTGIIRDFVVERGGALGGQLDLKKGGLAPVVGLARWVAIATGDVGGNTPERLRRGAARGLLTLDEAQTLAGAFEDVYTLALRHEADALRAGATPTTFIGPKTLDTLTRRHLRESLRAVHAVQAGIDENWMARLERMSAT